MARLNRAESKLQTRQRLLQSAKEVFAKNGFVGASVDDIAEHAGYSKGALYSNFESKEALFLELLHDRMAEELGDLEHLLEEVGSATEILMALRQRYSNLEKQVVWCLLSAEFQLQAGRNPNFAEPFAALYRNQRKTVARLLTMLAEKMDRKLSIPAEELATSLMALTHGIALQRAADPGSVPAAAAGNAIPMLLIAALGGGNIPAATLAADKQSKFKNKGKSEHAH